MATQVQVGQAGEQIVGSALTGIGYRTNIDTKTPGSADIEARGTAASLLVQVKTAVYPNEPANMSSDEERNIKSRATKLGYEAWEARVQVNSLMKLLGQIRWRKLN